VPTSSSDPWTAINAAGRKCFALLDEEAKAILPDEQRQFWTKRTAAFRSLELALAEWISTKGQGVYRAGGTPALLLKFRAGLYSYYADDYNQARQHFQDCRNDKNLDDPKATWAGKPIAPLVSFLFSDSDTKVSWAMSSTFDASKGLSDRHFDTTAGVQAYFSGSIAQSAESSKMREQKTYEGVHSILDQQKEWARRDSNASGIKFHSDKALLQNDDRRPR
jgi:hypothetical protein